MAGITELAEINQTQAINQVQAITQKSQEVSSQPRQTFEQRVAQANDDIASHVKSMITAPRSGEALPRISMFA
ncbi:hypothetical protein ACQZV8_03745 [Magnetococcales bacterium HHB-1]